jgi:hypothetical protein
VIGKLIGRVVAAPVEVVCKLPRVAEDAVDEFVDRVEKATEEKKKEER